jgi:hypothetical protein
MAVFKRQDGNKTVEAFTLRDLFGEEFAHAPLVWFLVFLLRIQFAFYS